MKLRNRCREGEKWKLADCEEGELIEMQKSRRIGMCIGLEY